MLRHIRSVTAGYRNSVRVGICVFPRYALGRANIYEKHHRAHVTCVPDSACVLSVY